jgi:hypothetical protein
MRTRVAQAEIGEKIFECVRDVHRRSLLASSTLLEGGLAAQERVAQTDHGSQYHSDEDDIQPNTCVNPTLRFNLL